MKVLPIVTLLHNLDLSHVQLCCQSMGVVNALESLQGVNDADHLTIYSSQLWLLQTGLTFTTISQTVVFHR